MGADFASDLGICPGCHNQVEKTARVCGTCGATLLRHVTTVMSPLSSIPPPSAAPRISYRPRAGEDGLSTADPLIGATVADRYRILSMIGRGGMGVVYKAEHSKIGKVMALKLLTGELARDRDTVRRFKREALLVSKLSHPNTVQVFDYGSVGGLTYLAMEYLSGRDLGDMLDQNGPCSFEQVAKIAIQACGALKEAHDQGMVHRDIKPENLFLTRGPSGEEIVKVLDFGLAKLRESKDLNEITSSGNIVGTPYYMPPEQVLGEEVDARGDVYAMCALIYTCITGTHVFEAPSPVAVLTQQVTGRVIPPHERTPHLNIPPGVSNILLKGLEKAPKDRFPSIDALQEALSGQLQGTSFTRLQLPDRGIFEKEAEESATRDEVERYERSLRRQKWLARGSLAALGFGALGIGAQLLVQASGPKKFEGLEIEPNHEVLTATHVPFGAVARGQLGKRIAPERGDQDNYSVTVPQSTSKLTHVRLSVTALPNMPLCAWVFRQGSESALAHYCSGAPGRGIQLDDLLLRPQPHLVVIKQDMDKYTEDAQPLVHENVSDDYEFSLAPAGAPAPAREVEPNESEEQLRGSSDYQPALRLDQLREISGRLNFMRDVDTVCATGNGRARFIVDDARGGARPRHAVLLLTPLGGPRDKIPVRIHGGRTGFEVTERDQPSPYQGPITDLSEAPCLRLELTPNPLAPTPHPIVAPASDHDWVVTLEPVTP